MPDQNVRLQDIPPLAKSTAATTALEMAGIPYAIHPAGSGAPSTSSDAPRDLKTILVLAGSEILSATLPRNRELDLQAIANAVGATTARVMTPDEARDVTPGDPQDASPLGLPDSVHAVLDASVTAHRSVVVASGLSGLGLEVLTDHLIDGSSNGLVCEP